MNIDFKGPIGFIFDVSSLTDTLDRDRDISPLAWQYVIEQDLIAVTHLQLAGTVPHCPSLETQYRLLRAMQTRYAVNFVCQLDPHILSHLKGHVLTVEMTPDILVIVKMKSISEEQYTCS